MREKAAITCIKLWDGRDVPDAIDDLIRDERDFHVRRCLEALKARMAGDAARRAGVRGAPRDPRERAEASRPSSSGMHTVTKAAPGFTRRSRMRVKGREAPPG